MKVKSDIIIRSRIAFLFVFLLAFMVVMRLGQIQFADGKKWKELARENTLRYKTVPATRGNIYSSDGSLLATSLPFYRVALDPTVCPDEMYIRNIDTLSQLLAGFYQDYPAEWYYRLIHNARKGNSILHQNPKRYLVINRKRINYQDKKKMMTWPIFKEGRYTGGVMFEKINIRFLPFNTMAQRTVGFINEDKEGVGLEYTFDKLLAGQDGKTLFQKVSGGEIPIYNENMVKPVDGLDIQTTLDINLQDLAHDALLKTLILNEAKYGCCILMEVKTGEIKAMVNLGRLKNGNYGEDYNYALGDQGLNEPGSTFKLASMIALLENTNVQLEDTVDTGKGIFKFYHSAMKDVNKAGYGKITLREAFEKSSNIGISKTVHKYFSKQPQKYIDALYNMGINKTFGFQIYGEAKPFIKNTKDKSWSGVSLPWISIGYELKLAPVHILTLYNAVANEGKMIQPIIVKNIKRSEKTVESFETNTIKPSICSKKTLGKIYSLLEGVVKNGTAKNIYSPNYTIAGKTGTAQKIENGRYIQKYSTSFVGYFPAENPMYSCIVIVDQPNGIAQTGSSASAPVFKEIADKIMALQPGYQKTIKTRELPLVTVPAVKSGKLAEVKELCNKLAVSSSISGEGEWAQSQRRDNAILLKGYNTFQNLVPNVQGMTLRDALYILEQNGLKVKVRGNGKVKNQSLNPGVRYERGMLIELEC